MDSTMKDEYTMVVWEGHNDGTSQTQSVALRIRCVLDRETATDRVYECYVDGKYEITSWIPKGDALKAQDLCRKVFLRCLSNFLDQNRPMESSVETRDEDVLEVLHVIYDWSHIPEVWDLSYGSCAYNIRGRPVLPASPSAVTWNIGGMVDAILPFNTSLRRKVHEYFRAHTGAYMTDVFMERGPLGLAESIARILRDTYTEERDATSEVDLLNVHEN